MKKIFNCATTLLFCSTILLGFYSTSHALSENCIITSHPEWAICSPVLQKNRADCLDHELLRAPGSLENLRHLGEQANVAWSHMKDIHSACAQFNTIFNQVDRNFLNSVIDQILQDDALLNSVTQASYRNVTGFLKIVLIDNGKDSWKIRLHVWENKEEKEFPHNHKWDFYSKIVSGYLSQELYEETDTNEGVRLYSVREPTSLMPLLPTGELPCPCRDNYVLRSKDNSGNIYLKIQRHDLIGLGESYMMPYHLIHTITPGKGAISVVFTSPLRNANSEVFVPEDMVNTNLQRYAPSVTKDELRQELIRIKKLFNQLHLQESYLAEIIDPQHHYYDVHRDTFHGRTWREVMQHNNQFKHVIQLSRESMRNFLVSADQQGNLLIDGKRVDATYDYLFTIVDGNMYAARKDFHHASHNIICHTSFTDYGPAESVGVLRFHEDGSLTTIEAYSGHYQPSLSNMDIPYQYLNQLGVNTENVQLISYQDRI